MNAYTRSERRSVLAISTRPVRTLRVLPVAVVVAVATLVANPMAASAEGTTVQWVGTLYKGDGYSWTNPLNWSTKQVPSSSDVIAIQQLPGGPAHVEGIPEGTTVSGLNLGPGGSVKGGSLHVTTAFNWTGGTVRTLLSVASTATARISQATETVIPNVYGKGSVELSGTTDWSGKLRVYPDSGTPATIVNRGVFHAAAGATMSGGSCCVNPFRFENEGTFTVAAGGPVVVANIALVNSGTIDVAGGSTLELTGGPSRFDVTGAITGTGRTLVTSRAAVTLTGDLNLGSSTFELGSGYVYGKGTLRGTARFVWSAGNIYGSITVAGSVKTEIVGAADKQLNRLAAADSGILNLNGPTTLSGTGDVVLVSSAVITNTSTFTAAPDTVIRATSCCISPSQFVNRGTFRVTAVAGVTAPLPVKVTNMAFTNTGTVYLVRGGSTLDVSGAGYTQTGTGRLIVTIEGPTAGNGYSQLTGRSASLDGTLQIRTLPPFNPAASQTFAVVSASSSRTGTFSQVVGATLGDGRVYEVRYTPTAVALLTP